VDRIRAHLVHHQRFYAAALAGALFFCLLPLSSRAVRIVAAGDVFYVVYLVLMAVVLFRYSTDDLRLRARYDDEGIFLVLLIVLAVLAVSAVAIVEVLRHTNGHARLPLALAVAGLPLGWCTLHTLASVHYARLYYAPAPDAPEDCSGAVRRGLEFPNAAEPGIWEFLYFAFVVGMTAQTSDVVVSATKMRRAVLGHSVVSFFYNTAIIAMAVNAVIGFAG